MNFGLFTSVFLMSLPLVTGYQLEEVLRITKECLVPYRLPMYQQKAEWIILLKGPEMIAKTLHEPAKTDQIGKRAPYRWCAVCVSHTTPIAICSMILSGISGRPATFSFVPGEAELLQQYYKENPNGSVGSSWYKGLKMMMLFILERSVGGAVASLNTRTPPTDRYPLYMFSGTPATKRPFRWGPIG